MILPKHEDIELLDVTLVREGDKGERAWLRLKPVRAKPRNFKTRTGGEYITNVSSPRLFSQTRTK